jgi:PHD/YefM family antitoxin component YafN of YafNO toxin-antitoxin module
MTLSVLLALFGLPLSLLALGGTAVLLHQRANGAPVADAKSPATAMSADMEARLAEVLEDTPDGGAPLAIHGKSGQVLGVLLARDEYELLTAVAASEPGSDRIEAEEQSDDHYVRLEEVFGLRRG